MSVAGRTRRLRDWLQESRRRKALAGWIAARSVGVDAAWRQNQPLRVRQTLCRDGLMLRANVASMLWLCRPGSLPEPPPRLGRGRAGSDNLGQTSHDPYVLLETLVELDVELDYAIELWVVRFEITHVL